MSLFNSPLMLGFEQFEQAIDRISKTASDGYPPYNVEKLSENRLRITLAVAGFSAEDMRVQIENNQLVIHGKLADDQSRVYLHRGIASRQFHRSFVLADGGEVVSASLDNGLLHIDLEWPLIEPAVRTIAIRSKNGDARPVDTQTVKSLETES
jgi:HSP20 family molecular chaperone IbpA